MKKKIEEKIADIQKDIGSGSFSEYEMLTQKTRLKEL